MNPIPASRFGKWRYPYIFAGAFTLRPFRGRSGFVFDSRNRMHVLMLLLIGASVGFMSGLLEQL